MTVSYSAQVSRKGTGKFLRLLFMWNGSIYKLVYKELVFFWLLYFLLNILYRFAYSEQEKEDFMSVCIFFKQYTNFVPLTFILAFYVTLVVGRWWAFFNLLAWPDDMAMLLLNYIPGMDDRSRLIRRTVMRWLCLCNVIVLRTVSTAAKKRYPTMDIVQKSGFITAKEQEEFDKFTYPSHVYWIPLKWCIELLRRSWQEGTLTDDRYLIELVTEVNRYRGCVGTVLDMDWVPIPLVYTQVVTVAVYTFFVALLFSRQYMGPKDSDMRNELQLMSKLAFMDNEKQNKDPYSPVILTTMQFLFYIGWLKVAETIINPLGLDDDDFEVNWLIDRNLKFSLLVVDRMFGQLPVLEKDLWWDEKNIVLAHTEASKGVKDTPPVTSQHTLSLTVDEMTIVHPSKPCTDLDSKQSLKSKIAETLGLGSGRNKSSHSLKTSSDRRNTDFKGLGSNKTATETNVDVSVKYEKPCLREHELTQTSVTIIRSTDFIDKDLVSSSVRMLQP